MKFSCTANKRLLYFVAVFVLMWSFAGFAHCREPETHRIFLFVSKNIKPYVEAVDGFRSGLEAPAIALPDVNLEVIMLDRYTEASLVDLAGRMANQADIRLAAAVGPEAAAFVWETFPGPSVEKMYFLILNPEKVIPGISPAAGVSLNIPPPDQLRLIHKSLSPVSRVGLFYDPAHNTDFFTAAAAASLELDITLVPLAVGSKKDIPFLLEECWDSIDCVWLIPDRTVISESIAQYIIKQAVLKKVPVVGYNRFFYDSGAAAAFVFDYADLGRQAAGLAMDMLRGRARGKVSPMFHVWLNASVFQKTGIPLPEPVELPLKVGP